MQQNYYKTALWHALYCMHRAKFVTVWNLTYLDLERERDLEREADLDLEWPRDFERLLRWLLLLLRLLRRLRDLQ